MPDSGSIGRKGTDSVGDGRCLVPFYGLAISPRCQDGRGDGYITKAV